LERREHRRYSVQALVNFEWTDREGMLRRGAGVTRDIGVKGMYIFSDSRPPKDEALDINVSFQSVAEADVKLQMRATGVVIRVEPSSIAGELHGFAVLNRIAGLHPGGPDDEHGVHD
jgi:PilZ domain-containing protein